MRVTASGSARAPERASFSPSSYKVDRFGNVRRPDPLARFEIRYGSSNTQHLTLGESNTLACLVEKRSRVDVKLDDLFQIGRCEIVVDF